MTDIQTMKSCRDVRFISSESIHSYELGSAEYSRFSFSFSVSPLDFLWNVSQQRYFSATFHRVLMFPRGGDEDLWIHYNILEFQLRKFLGIHQQHVSAIVIPWV